MKFVAGFVLGTIIGSGLMYASFYANVTSVVETSPGNTVNGVSYSSSDWKILRNNVTPTMSYRVSYPRDFDLTQGDSARGSGFLATFPVKIAFPADAFTDKQTNFGEAWITLDFKQDVTEKECYTMLHNPDLQMTEQAILGDNTYRVDHPTGEAAAGNLYESTVYRLAKNGGCFEATQTLHTSNVGNYDSGTVSEFDKTKTDKIFDFILSSLKFESV